MYAAGFRPRPDESSDSSGSEDDSDRELQEAFARGDLQPGLNVALERDTRTYANNVADMKAKTRELELGLPWVETLDSINGPAPMAPDVALQLQETTQRSLNVRANNAKLPKIDPSEDPVLNEFTRETLFHRQAQATVVESIRRLHALGIVTRRPETYFAEMAKTDAHMQKVRQNLMAKQAGQARAEKVRQLRQQKKMGKQLQAQTKQQRAKEKKAALNEVKKYRKGQQNQENSPFDGKSNKKSVQKKNSKNQKFGFGGKKRGMKTNTRESSSDFRDLHGVKKNKNHFKANSGKGQKKGNRPGKGRRVTNKAKKRG